MSDQDKANEGLGVAACSPRRIQRQRRKGWRMPENTVSVCRPGRFGNPFMVGPDRTQRQAVECFRAWLTTPHITAGIPEKKQAIIDGLESLRGKNLACFCKPGTACHADVLLDLANDQALRPANRRKLAETNSAILEWGGFRQANEKLRHGGE